MFQGQENEGSKLNEVGCEETLTTKSVDSLFAETVDGALLRAVDDVQLHVSGKKFLFHAGWKRGEAFLHMRIRGLSLLNATAMAGVLLSSIWGIRAIW